MVVTVVFPAGVVYLGSPEWTIDPDDGWTIQQFYNDVAFAARVAGPVRTSARLAGHKLQRAGVDLDGSGVAAEVLSDGDTVTLVRA